MRFMVLMLAFVLLMACDRSQQGLGAAPEQEVKSPANEVHTDELEASPTVAMAKGPEFKRPLAGGIVLSFPYKIAFDKSPRTKEGEQARAVGIEFLDGDVQAIDQRLAEAFHAVGFERKLPGLKEGATRSIYAKKGEPDVLVWVRPGPPPGPQYPPMSAEAKGTIYMAWKTPE